MTATSCPISSKSPRASLRLENHPSIKGEFVWWELVSCCPWPAALWLCDELKRSIYNSTFIKHAIWLIQLWDEHSVRLNCLNYTTMWGTNDKKKKKKTDVSRVNKYSVSVLEYLFSVYLYSFIRDTKASYARIFILTLKDRMQPMKRRTAKTRHMLLVDMISSLYGNVPG